MRWIQTEGEINKILGLAYTCVGVDSRRIPTDLVCFVFDELGIDTIEFAELVKLLIKLSGDAEAVHVVLRPDPIYYFHEVLGRYPAFFFEATDPPDCYLRALQERIRKDSIDNLGTFWSECVIASPSQVWFAHGVRTTRENGGHLWIPNNWTREVCDNYKWLLGPLGG